jgi:hypothetical protein
MELCSQPDAAARTRVANVLTAEFLKLRKSPDVRPELVDQTVADISKFAASFSIVREATNYRIEGAHADVYRRLRRGSTWHAEIPHVTELIVATVTTETTSA